MAGTKEWMPGLPGHKDWLTLEDILQLVGSGQLRSTDLVKKQGESWRTAN